jgi:anti-sigma factor RsiW
MDWFRNWFKSAAERRQEQLSAYVDGQLSPRERQHFEREMGADAALRQEVEQQQMIKSQLRRLPRRRAPRNFTLNPSLYGRPQPQTATWLYPAARTATALAAFFFVLALVLELAGLFAADPRAAPVAMEAGPADQPALAQPEMERFTTEEGEVMEIEGETFMVQTEAAEPVGTPVGNDIPPAAGPAGPAASQRLEVTAAATVPAPEFEPPLVQDLEEPLAVEMLVYDPADPETKAVEEAPALLSPWRLLQGALGAAVFILALLTFYLGRRTI